MYTVPTVQTLLIELNEISNWFQLGVHLDVPVYELKEIEQLNGGVKKYKIELFHLWLKKAKSPTWETVVYAVRQLDPNLAKRLAAKVHLQKPCLSTEVTEAEGTIKCVTLWLCWSMVMSFLQCC